MRKILIDLNIILYVIFSNMLVFNVSHALSASAKNSQDMLGDQITIQSPKDSNYGPDITFMSVDMKVNEGVLKFCDFGSALHEGINLSHGKRDSLGADSWVYLWNYLKQLKLPIWFIGNLSEKKEYALDVLRSCGGKTAPSLMVLEKDKSFKKDHKKKFVRSNRLKDYSGIIAYATPLPSFCNNFELSVFRKRYPDFLFVNYNTAEYIARKDYAYNLFKEHNLQQFKSTNNAYHKKYTKNLEQEIKEAIHSDFYVIKPVSAKHGCGELVITQDELDATLRLIINEKNQIPQSAHRNLGYWKYDKNDTFIVEAYVPSRNIVLDGKEYDPTLRMFFIAHSDGCEVHIAFLSGYWKLPVKSLSEEVAPSEKHAIANWDDKAWGELPLDSKDSKILKSELEKFLPLVYEKMLQYSHKKILEKEMVKKELLKQAKEVQENELQKKKGKLDKKVSKKEPKQQKKSKK